MLYAVAAISFLLAGYCTIMSIEDRMQYGSWYTPHWTVGGTFGIDERLFGSFGEAVAHQNAGWVFLAVTLLLLLVAFQRK
jgi:hypothetical protein